MNARRVPWSSTRPPRARVTARRQPYSAARRVLWGFLRERARGLRSLLRRRLGEWLGGRERGLLLRLVRDAAFAAAVAGALLGAGAGSAQAIELRDVAEGRGGEDS